MTLRIFARLTIALFIFSAGIPIVAGVLRLSQPPRWLQVTDLTLAALLVCAAAWITVAARTTIGDSERLAALTMTQWIAGLIPLLLAAFFLVGTHWDWTVLVIGIAWRCWLLIYSLPSLIGALRSARQ